MKSDLQRTGLCDSKGKEICVGDIVRHHTTFNVDVHGKWVDYQVKLRGLTPVLMYHRSQLGAILPVAYTGQALHQFYDAKMFLFHTDLSALRPQEDELVIVGR